LALQQNTHIDAALMELRKTPEEAEAEAARLGL
jgi:hypothetical protein